ncbi:uncharacterized protein TNCV_1884171 [Trichonephila clavipes]|nr:uncharacterized protein TNCV_1884171 [Trichonephila clavipes]
MESITAEDVAQTFFAGWISGFGSLEKITIDQGRQFESQLLKHFGMFTAFKRSNTTSYHPCSNGMIERVRRHLKASLMCHTDSSRFEALPAQCYLAFAVSSRRTFNLHPQSWFMVNPYVYRGNLFLLLPPRCSQPVPLILLTDLGHT